VVAEVLDRDGDGGAEAGDRVEVRLQLRLVGRGRGVGPRRDGHGVARGAVDDDRCGTGGTTGADDDVAGGAEEGGAGDRRGLVPVGPVEEALGPELGLL